MAFSGALTLTDLNDFITPSQACIKPVEQANGVAPKDPAAASTEIRVDSAGSYYEVPADELRPDKGTPKKLETAQISLNDCLACSGCITSAESVLITMQSHTEVLNFLAQNPPPESKSHKVAVLSIAPQSLASLAATISSSSKAAPVTLQQILRRVEAFSRKVLGFEHVYDTTFARHLALLEHAQEFRERKRGEGSLPMLSSACPGWICYAEKTHAEMLPFISRTKSPQQIMGTLVKEYLASKWGKSPDQIYHVTVMPCYDKKLEASRQDFYSELYSTRDVDCVLTTGELELMMREKDWDLSKPVNGDSFDNHSVDMASVRGETVVADPRTAVEHTRFPELINHPGTSSGSYLHSLISILSLSQPGDALELSVRAVRSADYEEYTLTERATGKVAFRGAKCYGFRNLQNVVRKVGREAGVQVGRGAAGRLSGMRSRGAKARNSGAAGTANVEEKGYDYVEVMACPGGCVNGGGQLRPPVQIPKEKDAEGYNRDWEASGVMLDGEDGGRIQGQAAKWGDKDWTKKVEEMYWHGLPTPPPSPEPVRDAVALGTSARVADDVAEQVLREVCRPQYARDDTAGPDTMDQTAEAKRRQLFRTQYRAVESEVVGLAVKW